MEATNHSATLSAALGDDADSVLAAMDNLNEGLAYVHQDAFKKVYDSLKNTMRDEDKEADLSKLYVDITMQKNTADMAIDKMTSSAIALITQQPEDAQDEAANVWVTGATLISDCMEITLREMDNIENKLDDFIRMEEAWNNVKASVVCAITGLKGVFSLMDQTSPQSEKPNTRSASIASTSSAMLRRLSNAFTPSTVPHSRSPSVSSVQSNFANFSRNGSVSSHSSAVYRSPNYVRNSVSNGCPTSMPTSNFEHHKLGTIPPTPAFEEAIDPFDNSAPPVPEVPASLAMSTR